LFRTVSIAANAVISCYIVFKERIDPMSETKFSKDHEYIRIEGDVGTIGITDYAQGQLGDVVFVELPAPGKTLTKGAEAAVVESVKAASEVYAPVSGTVTEVNKALEGAPATINDDPEGAGWFMKIKLSNPSELSELMTEADYKTFVASL
jgi:glycine cleavage system H protein